jgi:maltooligosyltrehalose trehalohydrolase
MLWMGEEWGAQTPWCYFTSHTDPALAEAVRQGRRREFASFGWAPEDVPDPQAAETFERSRLDWRELDDDAHADLLKWHRALIALRREHRLWEGESTARVDPDARQVVVQRPTIEVVASFDGKPVTARSGAETLLASASVVLVRR